MIKVVPALVGIVAVTATVILAKIFNDDKKKKKTNVALRNPETKYPLTLIKKIELSHDSRLFRFALSSEDAVLGLPIGQHVYLSARINDKLVIRPYTPTSNDDENYGYMDLVVKIYFKNVHPEFPDGGKMSQYLNNLKIGEAIDVRGPNGLLEYIGRSVFSIKVDKKSSPKTFVAKKVSMIAGGTGITPMYQLITAIFRDSNDETCVSLLFANQTEEDILLRKDLEALSYTYPEKFKLWYTVDRPSDLWQYSNGFINQEMIQDHLFPPGNDSLVLMCGPPPMIKFACLPNLEKIGHSTERLFTF